MRTSTVRCRFAYRRCAGTAVTVALGGSLVLLALASLGGAVESSSSPGRAAIALHSPHVVVLKGKRVLHLFDGDRLVRTYPIDLGGCPQRSKRLQGDGRTPIGRFRVVTKNEGSRYHRFLGLDYPNVQDVEWGLARGLISPGEAASIKGAIAAKRCPDWGTALGGGIGIHGGWRGVDWTGGCIALSDEHVAELFEVLRIGDPVEVLP